MAATDIDRVTRMLRRLVESNEEAGCTALERVAAIEALRSVLSMRAARLRSCSRQGNEPPHQRDADGREPEREPEPYAGEP